MKCFKIISGHISLLAVGTHGLRHESLINMVMRSGDKFLTDGNAHIALSFYREAVYLFPATAICNIEKRKA